MRIFFDTEFDDDGKTIELISIGMVRDDGKTYYAVCSDADWDRIKENTWLVENVLPHLPEDSESWKPRETIAKEIIKFVGPQPEFWVGTGAYDWVALMQLCFGPMVAMSPELGWPWCPNDVKTYQRYLDIKVPLGTQNDKPHDALSDAIEIKDRWLILRQIENQRKAR